MTHGSDSSSTRHDHTRHPGKNTAIDGFDLNVEPSVQNQPKTIRKWRSRDTIENTRMEPRTVRSISLTLQEEAASVTFRKKTLLPIDACLNALQRELPSLARSSLHRLYYRHGISQLPKAGNQNHEKKRHFKHYPMGYHHIDTS